MFILYPLSFSVFTPIITKQPSFCMEVEPQKKKYKLLFANDRSVEIDEDILPYFLTLYNMIGDCGGGDDDALFCSTGIPMTVESVTPEIMEALMAFYKSVNTYGPKEVGIYWPLSLIGTPFAMDSEGNMNDSDALYQLMDAASYLDLNAFLVYMVEHLDKLVRALPLEELKARYEALQNPLKRKRENTKEVVLPLPYRLQYRYELYVRDVLQSMIPGDLVPGPDERIIKYVNPVVYAPFITLVLNESGRPNAIDVNGRVTDLDARTSLRTDDIERLTQNSLINEVSAGDTFFCVLSEDGELSFYGEITLVARLSMDPRSGKAQPLFNKPPALVGVTVLGVWSGENMIMALSREGLHYWGRDKTLRRPDYVTGMMAEINPHDVLQVAMGKHHVLILTKNGLRVWGYLYVASIFSLPNFKPLKPVNVMHIFNEKTKKEEKIEKVFASDMYSVVLAKSGIFYYPRSTDNVDITWHPINEIPQILVSSIFIALNRRHLSFIIGDKEWLVILPGVSDEKKLTTHTVKSLSRLQKDILVISYTACDKFTLIGTPHALYLSLYDSSLTPYKLNVEFGDNQEQLLIENEEEEEEEEEDESASQRRRIDLTCDRCSAKALFMHTKQEKLFCSTYCFRKQYYQ